MHNCRVVVIATVISTSLAACAEEKPNVSRFEVSDLFQMKSALEQQIEHHYTSGPIEEARRFDFLIGDWDLVRKSFNAAGDVAHESKGVVSARYTFDGRVIQEDFFNYLPSGEPYRAGTALYTYSPLSNAWVVAAVDASIGGSSYTPEWVGDEVRYSSTITLPDRNVFTRNRIFNISEDFYEWEQEVSLDGKVWHKNYHILNTRKN